jgi:hypothetical protein
MRAKMPYLIVDKKPFDQFDFFQNLNQELNLTLNQQISK